MQYKKQNGHRSYRATTEEMLSALKANRKKLSADARVITDKGIARLQASRRSCSDSLTDKEVETLVANVRNEGSNRKQQLARLIEHFEWCYIKAAQLCELTPKHHLWNDALSIGREQAAELITGERINQESKKGKTCAPWDKSRASLSTAIIDNTKRRITNLKYRRREKVALVPEPASADGPSRCASCNASYSLGFRCPACGSDVVADGYTADLEAVPSSADPEEEAIIQDALTLTYNKLSEIGSKSMLDGVDKGHERPIRRVMSVLHREFPDLLRCAA